MPGIFLNHDGRLVQLTEAPYKTEAVLQELIAQHPKTLAGDEGGSLLLVRREASVYDDQDVASHGVVDHLFLDADGVPVLVEVKRSTDTRIRREVVGQMLDYATGAANWTVEQLKEWLTARCVAEGLDDVEEIGRLTSDPEGFWQRVRENLHGRHLRLIFVADAIPARLRATVEFLNEQLTDCEVLAIEVKQYLDPDGNQTIVVPTVLGNTEKAKVTKGTRKVRRWDRLSFLEELASKQPAGIVAAVNDILDWADQQPGLAWRFGHGGTDGSIQFGIQNGELRAFPLVLYSSGWLELPFVRMADYAPFSSQALRQGYVDRVAAIEGFDLPPDAAGKRPNLALDVLVNPASRRQFLDSVGWALEQCEPLPAAGPLGEDN
ncbi:hypothetical protein [Baekduia sp.]|jgi:hypothetical protein|uniref:hypothetical protein n=1 Tax=Baekduia sp. TaxID=2600305 RepID=UPI002E0ACAFF|nr:hypothetical protein [Baekduia sp.]